MRWGHWAANGTKQRPMHVQSRGFWTGLIHNIYSRLLLCNVSMYATIALLIIILFNTPIVLNICYNMCHNSGSFMSQSHSRASVSHARV